MKNKAAKKLLFITGSGASASLTKKDSVISGVFGFGKYQTLPLGDELVARIVAYKSKSFCWLVSLFCWRLVNDFEGIFWQTNFFNFVEKIEGFWPKYIKDSYQPYYPYSANKATNEKEKSKNEKKLKKRIREYEEKIENFLKENRQIFTSKDESFKTKFFQNSNFLKEKLSPENHENSSEKTLAKILFLTLLDSLLKKIKEIFKSDKILTEEFLNDLWSKIENIFTKLEPLLKPSEAQKLRIIENSINGFGVYEEKNKSWKEAQEEILKLTSNQENYDVVECLKKLIDLTKQVQNSVKKDLLQSHFTVIGLFGIAKKDIGINALQDIDENILQNIRNFEKDLSEILQNFKSEEKFLWFGKILNCFEKVALNNKASLKKSQLRLQDSFDKIVEEARKIRSQIFKEISPNCGNLENQNFISVVDDLKNLFITASIVEHYEPYSIDYFMMNLKQLAPYEFFDSNVKRLDKDEAGNREEKIQKYTKFIIAECLGNSAFFGLSESHIQQDNYLRRLRWKILENAFFYYRVSKGENAFEEYLKNDVKIITFNYENSLELIAFESFERDLAKSFFENNVSHVYGYLELKVGLKENGKEISQNRSNWGQDALLKSLFYYDACNDEKIKLFPDFFGDDKTYFCKNFFEQIENSIKWIGEEDNQEKILANRRKYQNQFIEANEIYFLGFGFDNENLYQLGIINKNQQLEESLKSKLRGKKILISGANPKIISNVRKIFETTEQIVDATLTTLSKPDLNFEILLSSKFLPEALSQDL